MWESESLIFLQGIFTASTVGEFAVIFLARIWIFVFAPIIAWLWVYGTGKEKHASKEALWALGLALLIGEALSLIVMRLRPYINETEIVALIPPPLTSSFPSIHTASSMALTSAFFSVNRRLGELGLLIALGVAVGRMAAGVHYPTDILGGVFIGIFSFLLVRLGHKALRKKPA